MPRAVADGASQVTNFVQVAGHASAFLSQAFSVQTELRKHD